MRHSLPARPILRHLVLALAVVALAAVTVVPVAAKGGFEARLDAPISIDSAPGSTLSVGWSVFTVVDGNEVPMYGTPVMIRLLPRGGGEPVMVFGTERPSGTGHYLADILVPAGGIRGIEIGLRGEMCESGVCTASDMLFHLTGEALVSGDVAGAVVGVARWHPWPRRRPRRSGQSRRVPPRPSWRSKRRP